MGPSYFLCLCVRISLCVNREGVCLLVSVSMCNFACACVCDREFACTDVCICECVQCASACVCDTESLHSMHCAH